MIGKVRIVRVGGYDPDAPRATGPLDSDPEAEAVSPPEGSFPRRIDMLRWTPAERAIYDAAAAVGEAGAHPLLTDAGLLLAQARDKVADFVDLPKPEAPT